MEESHMGQVRHGSDREGKPDFRLEDVIISRRRDTPRDYLPRSGGPGAETSGDLKFFNYIFEK